ncbi:MAG: hypothetical protein HY303_19735 [Candidatus Wallbacteria bacterium]|nr:hypothetical protein [Candidatus Wallbacteria bacterium]
MRKRLVLLPVALFAVLLVGPVPANPGYGPKCFQCHTSPSGGSSDLNGVGAKYARDGHKFPKDEKKDDKKEGGEGSAEGSSETTGSGGSAGGSGTTTGAGGGGGGSEGGGGDGGGSGSGSGSTPEPPPDTNSSSSSSGTPVDNSPAVEGPATIVPQSSAPMTTAQVPPKEPAGAASTPAAAAASGGGDPSKELARYGASGKKIFELVSPKLSSIGKSCNSCHGNNALAGKWNQYPKYRAEVKKVVTVEQAIDWCLENNMKGKVFALDDKYMVALSVYLKGLTK